MFEVFFEFPRKNLLFCDSSRNTKPTIHFFPFPRNFSWKNFFSTTHLPPPRFPFLAPHGGSESRAGGVSRGWGSTLLSPPPLQPAPSCLPPSARWEKRWSGTAARFWALALLDDNVSLVSPPLCVNTLDFNPQRHSANTRYFRRSRQVPKFPPSLPHVYHGPFWPELPKTNPSFSACPLHG